MRWKTSELNLFVTYLSQVALLITAPQNYHLPDIECACSYSAIECLLLKYIFCCKNVFIIKLAFANGFDAEKKFLFTFSKNGT